MPWSNHSGGPWGQKGGSGNGGGGGKNPWGSSGGGGGGNEPPNIEDILRQSQDKLKNIFGGGKGGGGSRGVPGGFSFGGKGAVLIVLIAVALWLATGFYTVRSNENAVNLIFGRYTGTTGEGLNYNLPYPIGQVLKFDVTTQRREEIGFRSEAMSRASELQLQRERLMLTGDENIVSVSFFVIWQIDPNAVKQFAFTLQSPKETVKAVAESAMREEVGRSNIQDVLTTRREAVARNVLEIMKQTLKGYDSGILINNVQIQLAEPPEQVRGAFFDVNAAQQEAAQKIYEANTYANRILPQARGDAAATVQKAEGYKAQMVAEGTGQATYFKEVYEAYKISPAIVRERIFLETMENVLKGANKVILDQNAQGGTGVIPFLPLTQPNAK